MGLEIYVCDGVFYIRGPDQAALKWTLEEGHWGATQGELPANAVKAKLDEVPKGLLEELMAFAARAATMGNQIWSMVN
jgi:hypothetical protein